MNTVLQARPRNFVPTPTVDRVARRALRYLQSGYSVHLKGPAGTGKTTLALHLADLLGRPIMLLFGDDEFKTSDLIGNQSGYTRKKVVDNFIHSVVKVEDELRHNWVDSRLTLACREGFTLVYDEFNRSRPEVNNVLLSALEERLLVLPPNNNRSEYIRVNPHFRAIFTSNPEEYCGVHGTQDALLDRLITINMPESDELAQQQILVQKVGIDASSALQIVRLVKAFQTNMAPDMVSSLRPSLMIASICHQHEIPALAENPEFRDICCDVLLSRSKEDLPESTRHLWDIFNRFIAVQEQLVEAETQPKPVILARLHGEADDAEAPIPPEPITPEPVEALTPEPTIAASESLPERPPEELESTEPQVQDEAAQPEPAAALSLEEPEPTEPQLQDEAAQSDSTTDALPASAATDEAAPAESVVGTEVSPPTLALVAAESAPIRLTDSAYEASIYQYLEMVGTAKLADLETGLHLNRFQVVNALKSMLDRGLIEKVDDLGLPSVYQIRVELEQSES